MRRRVTVVALSVSLSVCLSVTTLAAASFISTIKLRYEGLQLSILFLFNSRIFKKNASFKSYGVIIRRYCSHPCSVLFSTEEGSEVVKSLKGV